MKRQFLYSICGERPKSTKAEDHKRLSNFSADLSVVSEREWRKLVGMYNAIQDFDPLTVLIRERLRRSLIEGLPDSLRGEIWCILCHVKQEQAMHAPGFYQKLAELENPEEEYKILKDVVRTFTNYPCVKQPMYQDGSESSEVLPNGWNSKAGEDALSNILLAYANYDSQVGYV